MTETIKPDLDATIGFLEAFAPDGPINLCAMNANTGRVEGATFNDLGAARTWLAQRVDHANLYYTVNPSPHPSGEAGRVRKADIPECHHAHADLDCDKAVDDLTLEQRKAVKLAELEASDHPPTFITDSGGGLQPVWRLEASVSIEQVEGINRWLSDTYGGDPGTWNADRLLRLPGTINFPSEKKRERGRVVAPTKLVRSTGELHGVESFGRIDAPSKAEADIVLGAPEEVDIEILGLPERLLTIIRDSEVPGEVKPGDNSASGWLFDGVVNMLRHGVMPEQVLCIILDPDLGISTSVLKRPDADQLRYAEHQVRSALATIEGERSADVKLMGDLDPEWLKDNNDDLPEPKKLGGDEERIGRLTLVHADRVEMKPLTPLWPGRIYIGKLTTLAGVPDQGKSMVTCDIAARVSRGLAWPDGSGFAPKGTAIFLAAEDDKADTIVPRLAAAGADLTKVKILNSLVISHKDKRQQRTFNIAEDIAELNMLIRRYPDTRFLFIDPTNAFMGTSKENDSFRDSDVRAVLGPLKEWAEEHGVAVVLITTSRRAAPAVPSIRSWAVSPSWLWRARRGLSLKRRT